LEIASGLISCYLDYVIWKLIIHEKKAFELCNLEANFILGKTFKLYNLETNYASEKKTFGLHNPEPEANYKYGKKLSDYVI